MERRVTIKVSPVVAFGLRLFIHPLLSRPMMDKSMAALKSKLEG